MVGRDWSHSGITSLFRNIRANGYKFMYLTSRAIAQADATRDYLTNLSQVREIQSPLWLTTRVGSDVCSRFLIVVRSAQ
jgi:phosphatidate phosphatase PAH1